MFLHSCVLGGNNESVLEILQEGPRYGVSSCTGDIQYVSACWSEDERQINTSTRSEDINPCRRSIWSGCRWKGVLQEPGKCALATTSLCISNQIDAAIGRMILDEIENLGLPLEKDNRRYSCATGDPSPKRILVLCVQRATASKEDCRIDIIEVASASKTKGI